MSANHLSKVSKLVKWVTYDLIYSICQQRLGRREHIAQSARSCALEEVCWVVEARLCRKDLTSIAAISAGSSRPIDHGELQGFIFELNRQEY